MRIGGFKRLKQSLIAAAIKQDQCPISTGGYQYHQPTPYSYSTSAPAAQTVSEPHQLSRNLIKIMEQKLSAIESRHAYLQSIVNQVTNFLAFFDTHLDSRGTHTDPFG